MDAACYAERRAFLRMLATTTAGLAVGGCYYGGAQPASSPQAAVQTPVPLPPPPPPVGNQAPVWLTVPTITFTQNNASSVSIAAYVSDPNGDALTITKNSAALPAGVTYDAANKRFVYDGAGPVGATSGVVLTADDGKP